MENDGLNYSVYERGMLNLLAQNRIDFLHTPQNLTEEPALPDTINASELLNRLIIDEILRGAPTRSAHTHRKVGFLRSNAELIHTQADKTLSAASREAVITALKRKTKDNGDDLINENNNKVMLSVEMEPVLRRKIFEGITRTGVITIASAIIGFVAFPWGTISGGGIIASLGTNMHEVRSMVENKNERVTAKARIKMIEKLQLKKEL